MKKRLISAIISGALLVSMSAPALAWNYTFTSGANPREVFDSPTKTDDCISENPNANVRRDKNTALTPPPYGVFSGYIPTDVANPLHRHDRASGVAPAVSVSHVDFPSSAANTTGDIMLPATTFQSGGVTARTQPSFFADGSMGVLEVPRFNREIVVRYGATDPNLLIGAGHITGTATWYGNIAIAGHNRGVPLSASFGFLADMRISDTIIYSTPHGSRTYAVVERRQVLETDTSILGWSGTNILTLVTCIAYTPQLRLVVILAEI